MGTLITDFQDEHRQAISLIGIFLLVGFIFPVYVWGFRTGKLIFVNFELLGKSDFLSILGLLYPLAAGIIVLWAGKNLETMSRPVVLLSVGFFPLLLSIFNKRDFMAGSIREYNSEIPLTFLVLIALIGVFIGSKIVSKTDHISGRLIGGISGLVFMMCILLPIGKGGTPIYFELFKLFRAGPRAKLPGSLLFLGITLIAIFTCYLFASLISVLNFSYKSSSEQTATNAYRLVFYASLALPVSIVLTVLFSSAQGGMKGMIFTLMVKLTLLFGGIIGAITTGLWDLIDQLLPRTFRGGDLLNTQDQVYPGPPPGI